MAAMISLRCKRVDRRLAVLVLFLASAGAAAAGPQTPGIPMTAAMRKDAARIQDQLDRIAAEHEAGRTHPPRTVTFTENELNAWIAGMIEANSEDVLRELVLKLFADNRVEGKAFIDLSRASLPLGLKPKMTLFFAARVISREGAARIEFDKLFLEGQVIPIAVLDLMIAVASGLGKSDAASIKDWVALPDGIKDLRSRPGLVEITY
jgi:hypothetical protein